MDLQPARSPVSQLPFAYQPIHQLGAASSAGAARPEQLSARATVAATAQGAAVMPPARLAVPNMLLAIGLPGSGKSTWCQQYVQSRQAPVTVISMDACYEAYAAERGQTYRQAYLAMAADKSLRDACELTLTQRCQAAIAAKEDIIVDRTNMTVSHRARWLSMVPLDYRKVGVVFGLSVEDALARAKERKRREGKEVPAFVFGHKANLFEDPSKTHEFDALFYVTKGDDFRPAELRALPAATKPDVLAAEPVTLPQKLAKGFEAA